MLVPAMRKFITVTALIVVVGVAALTWLATRRPSAAQTRRIAAVLESTAPADEPAAYAHCASCHLHDGSGRPDGSIPRLNGQRRAVLENKLHRLRTGVSTTARDGPVRKRRSTPEGHHRESRHTYPRYRCCEHRRRAPGGNKSWPEVRRATRIYCASCHGANARRARRIVRIEALRSVRGVPAPAASLRVAAGDRGDADAIMRDASRRRCPIGELRVIATWLAAGRGCVAP